MLSGLRGKLNEECGVFGIYAPGERVSRLTYLGLHSLQHRGQESAGIVVERDGELFMHKDLGLIDNIFNEELLDQLQGDSALGHVRYSTSGALSVTEAQPLLIKSAKGNLALAHNGHLCNNDSLRKRLEAEGSIFHSGMDTEVIVHLIARSRERELLPAIFDSLKELKGAYSLIIITPDQLIGIRDPLGIRPLTLGQLDGNYLLASETCAFDIVGAKALRDLRPGELMVIDQDGVTSYQYARADQTCFCIFEYIYFARPDSTFDSLNVHLARKRMGRELAREMEVEADVVIPVPDSGISAAQGFAEEKGISYQHGLLKNRYVGRTFIQPEQELRDLTVKLKLSPIREVFKGQDVVLVDDSIVRGTTSNKIVRMIREAGARRVHFGVSSPPITNPCYYGVDTSSRGELIAAEKSSSEIETHIGADSLQYLSLSGLLAAMGNGGSFCTACLDGNYPVDNLSWEYLSPEVQW